MARAPLRSLVLILLAGILLGGSSLGYQRTALDSPAFTLMGKVILEGGAPYRDVWDVKGPGIYFANALCIALFGESTFALRLFDALWQLLTALLLAEIAWLTYGSRVAHLLAGFAYLLFYFSQNFWSWAQPDGLLNLTLAMNFWAILKASQDEKLHWWFAAGAGVALAALFKLPMGIAGVAALGAAFFFASPSRQVRLFRLGGLAAGFLLPLLLCGGYLAAVGALGDYLESQYVFAPQYVKVIQSNWKLSCFLFQATRPVLFGLGGFLFLAAVTAAFFRARPKLSPADWLMVMWFACALMVTLGHGFTFLYHALPLLPPAVVLGAGATAENLAAARAGRHLRWILVGLAALLVVVPAKKLIEHTGRTWTTFRQGYPKDLWREPGQYIRDHTQPSDRILMWGNAAAIYLHAERRPASRYISLFPLLPQWRNVPYRDNFLKDLAAPPAAYFIVIKNVQRSPDGCGVPMDEAGALASFPAVGEILATQYTLEKETDTYLLHRRNTP